MREITSAPGVKNGLLMGRKTFESIGRVLPNRETIVVTGTGQLDAAAAHLHCAPSIVAAIEKGRTELALDVLWVFGGATVYDQVLEDPELREMVDGFFITRVPERECDTFIRTNLCEFISSRPAYVRLFPLPVALECAGDGVYELDAYSRLPASRMRGEWTLILEALFS
jgi:dihydrofolate reductase